MKKSMTASSIFTFLSANILMGMPSLDVKKEMAGQGNPYITIEMAGQEKKIITYGEFQKIIENIVESLKERDPNITPDKIEKIREMAGEYMANEGAILLAANAAGVAKSPAVIEKIKLATEQITRDAFKILELEKEKKIIAENRSNIEDMKTRVASEKGDQVTLVIMTLPEANDADRIVNKIRTLRTIDAKTKEWTKISNNLNEKIKQTKQLEPMLISQLPDVLKKELQNCKTGDVVKLSIPDAKEAKSTQVTLFFVAKREKIRDDLLARALLSEITAIAEKKMLDNVMSKVTIQKFDRSGQIIKAPAVTEKAAG
jgi:hypothetical protein